MGHAILYCSGCSSQLRDPDFEKGTAFRWEGRAFCKQCAPEAARSRVPPPERKPDRSGNTSRIQLVTPSSRAVRIDGVAPPPTPKWIFATGGAVGVVGLILAMAVSGGDPARPPIDPEPPIVNRPPDPAPPPVPRPVPPSGNERAAEEALRKARDFAQVHREDLVGQLVLFEAAVRASEETGHAAAAVRERDAVRTRRQAKLKEQLAAVDAALRAACEKEEFGRALKLLEEARPRPLGPEWSTEIDQRARTVSDNAEKLFAPIKKDAVEARKKGAEEVVRRLTQRVDRWDMESFSGDLARVMAATKPKPPPPPPVVPKEVDTYRRRWTEAMATAAGRDYAAAIKKIEDLKAGLADPAVQAEATADLEALRVVTAAHDEAAQSVAKLPRGQKLSIAYRNEGGSLAEVAGTVVRIENHELEVAREKGIAQIPLGEIAARSLAQLVKGRREGRALALLCLLEGDAEGAKGFVEGTGSIPDKYWTLAAPTPAPAEAEARRLFYAADRDLGSYLKAAEAAQKFAGLLKERGETGFVRRNRPLIAARAERSREFFFVFEDLRMGGALKAFKGEKDELYWKSQADQDPARIADNFVEIAFSVLPESEYRCWFYVGGCCTESVTCSYQVSEGAEPSGEAPMAVKQPPSMPFRTHASHAGRGRPVPRWGWVQIPLPKFATGGVKKVRVMTAQQGFCVAQALVSAGRQAPPPAGEAKDLERDRVEVRGVTGRPDPSLVAHWNFADGSGTVAVDSSPSGIEGKLVNGATWAPGTLTPWSPPSLKLAGKAYVDLGTNLSILQNASGYTMAAWICPDKISGAPDENKIFSISKHNGVVPTSESRAALTLVLGGALSVGGRSTDAEKLQSLRTTEKVIKTGTWTHVAGVVDLAAGTIAVYVNGAAQPTLGTVAFSAKSTPNTPSTCAAIGSEEDAAKWTFQGRMSNLRIYNRALGKDEIAELAIPPQSLR